MIAFIPLYIFGMLEGVVQQNDRFFSLAVAQTNVSRQAGVAQELVYAGLDQSEEWDNSAVFASVGAKQLEFRPKKELCSALDVSHQCWLAIHCNRVHA